MRFVKQFAVLLLVAIWLPASSHALLQHAGLIHEQHEHEHDAHADTDHHPSDADDRREHDANDHAAADGLCLLASAKVQVPTPGLVTLSVWLTALITLPADSGETALHSGLSPPGTAPPELSHIWQFSFRTALPVRAP